MKHNSAKAAVAAVSAIAAAAATGVLLNNFAMKAKRENDRRRPPAGSENFCTGPEGTAERFKQIKAAAAEWTLANPPRELSRLSREGLPLFADIYTPQPDSHKWVVAVHGYTSRASSMSEYIELFADRGFNALAPDLRAHGRSGGDWIGMGYPDRLDVLDWLDVLIESDPDAEIVLFGVSMGAATVLMTTGEPLPPNVKCVIADCGYTSVHDILKTCLNRQFRLPSFPFMNAASIVNRVRQGYYFRDGSAVKAVASSSAPIMIIHGGGDTFVPTYMADEIYRNIAADCRKEKLIVEGAGHASSYYAAPELYKKSVTAFLDDVL